jgi:hypothetical protein
MFEYLEEDYWQKMELEESHFARLMAHIQTLWINQGLQEGQAPEIISPLQFMPLHSLRNTYPGWVKTVNGWIRESELAESQRRVQENVREIRRLKGGG